MYKATLRSRLVLALVIIVTVTSSLFTAGVLLLKQRLEEIIFEDMVREQFELLASQLRDGSYSEDHLFKNWRFAFGTEVSALPPAIRSLPPGSHHSVWTDGRYYQVEAGVLEDGPAFLSYDITEWEKQEHGLLRLLAYGIGLLAAVALALGWGASESILAPVRALTRRVADTSPGHRHEPLAADFAGNDVGPIAAAFDRYLERVERFVERERSFTAAASHELRTPLSVMLGAVDVLEANPQSPASSRALARIRRACREMQAFIEATLFLAREDSRTIGRVESADLAGILDALLEDSRDKLAEKGLRVETRYLERPRLPQPASLLQIAVGNLLRNAIEHSADGMIRIELSATALVIEDDGEGISPELLPHVFERHVSGKPGGTGMGLNIVRRICERFGWTVSLLSRPRAGTRAVLDFGSGAG